MNLPDKLKRFVMVCAVDDEGGLSPAELKKAETFAVSMGGLKLGTQFGVKSIFVSPTLSAVQTADWIHDHLKKRMRILSALAETDTAEPPEQRNERAEAALVRAFESAESALIVTHPAMGLTLAETLGVKLPHSPAQVLTLYAIERQGTEWQARILETGTGNS